MRFLHFAVERFKIELKLAKMFWLKLDDLQCNYDQTVESAIEEEQIQQKARDVANAASSGNH